MNPQRPLPPEWEPSPLVRARLNIEFGKHVDIDISLRRFRNHYSEGQVSRNWEARFENWVIADAQRVIEKKAGGTDDLGVPHNQRTSSTVVDAPQPGDEGYVSIDDLIAEARRVAAERPRVQ